MHGYVPFIYRNDGEDYQHCGFVFLILLLQGTYRNLYSVLQQAFSHSAP